MKQYILAIVTLAFFACGTPKTVTASKKVIKGNWNLSSITYSKTGNFNVTLLNDTSKDCFISSNWQFIPNNNTGMYAIINNDCSTGDRNFTFTIQEVDATTGLYDFLLKPTNEKGKSETNQGFRFKLNLLTENEMQWEQTVTLDGAPFNINMNFSKL